MTRRTEITVERNSRITVPMVPNFIRLDDVYKPLSQFTVAQLRAIGEAWTDRLVARAQEQRVNGSGATA